MKKKLNVIGVKDPLDRKFNLVCLFAAGQGVV